MYLLLITAKSEIDKKNNHANELVRLLFLKMFHICYFINTMFGIYSIMEFKDSSRTFQGPFLTGRFLVMYDNEPLKYKISLVQRKTAKA